MSSAVQAAVIIPETRANCGVSVAGASRRAERWIHAYRTMNLAGVFVRERGLFMKPENKGRFYHDGRFATLLDVVQSYNERFGLNLSAQEESDLVEYLKSL